MHVHETTVRLQHTDGAGVVFFARYFELAHIAYEELMESLGVPLPADLAGWDPVLPIVRAESDYKASLRLGDRVRIEVLVAEVKSRSFTLRYRFLGPDGSEAAVLSTVHVAVDRATGRSTRLPDELRAAFADP